MEDNFYESEKRLELRQEPGTLGVGRYAANTFLLMCLGLLVTFGTAWFVAFTRPGLRLLVRAIYATDGYIHMILLIAELVVAIGMTAMLKRISTGTALVFFFLYSFLTGLTFSVIFLVYEVEVLAFSFGLTALYFGGMAVFGYLTHVDLTRLRPLLLGGLIFLVVANLLMIFIPGVEAAEQAVCTIGVVIFLGYTAYDTQRIRQLYLAYEGDREMLGKAAVFSALQLYLDFVNMFLYLLRMLGKRSKR